jgi:hypothetical protein
MDGEQQQHGQQRLRGALHAARLRWRLRRPSRGGAHPQWPHTEAGRTGGGGEKEEDGRLKTTLTFGPHTLVVVVVRSTNLSNV